MKRSGVICLALASCMLFGGCSSEESSKYSGEIVAFGGNPEFFELDCGDDSYGFLITEETKLTFEDPADLDEAGYIEGEDMWDYFGCSMTAQVTAGEPAQAVDEYISEHTEAWYYAEEITVTGILDDYFAVDAKPVIYLYPEKQTKVSVKLEYDGNLTCTYPRYDGCWEITADPDGTLTDSDGKQYNYLYWEGESTTEYDLSEGFCIAGKDTADFLESALQKLGLSRREANEFIVYYLPMMQSNEYNLISFQTETYTDHAKLFVSPSPDTVIRVFMAWKPLDSYEEVKPQPLFAPERNGFTLVEWGGSKVN